MPKYVEFYAQWVSSDKIGAIKELRRATLCNLKVGKEQTEAAQDQSQKWRMTPHQFGIFSAIHTGHFHVRALKLIELNNDVVDFTKFIDKPYFL